MKYHKAAMEKIMKKEDQLKLGILLIYVPFWIKITKRHFHVKLPNNISP